MEGAADGADERIRGRVRSIVADVARVDIAEVVDSVSIREELVLDSLLAMRVIAACEREFGLRIDERQVADVQTIGQFADLVASHCARRRDVGPP
jgi:acyl carrier protein